MLRTLDTKEYQVRCPKGWSLHLHTHACISFAWLHITITCLPHLLESSWVKKCIFACIPNCIILHVSRIASFCMRKRKNASLPCLCETCIHFLCEYWNCIMHFALYISHFALYTTSHICHHHLAWISKFHLAWIPNYILHESRISSCMNPKSHFAWIPNCILHMS